MRVLIACEFSGVVRRAFRAKGHDAWSCDLLPSEDGSEFHIQADCVKASRDCWDLMIAHPPCTYLCNSGVRWLAPTDCGLNEGRHKLMQQACDLFAALYHAPIPKVAIENPVMHKYARDYLQSAWKVPARSFTIQPWQFGEPETKRTCFWTRNLPDLISTNVVSGRTPRVHHASPGPERWKERSRTLKGVAQAMAEQWGFGNRLPYIAYNQYEKQISNPIPAHILDLRSCVLRSVLRSAAILRRAIADSLAR